MALTNKLAAIGDAIRAKTGSTAKLTLDEMPGAIAGISGGSQTTITLQNKTITENGTYTADSGYDGLGQVTVSVTSGGGGISASEYADMLLTTPLDDIDSNVTQVRKYACYGMTNITTINLPNATLLDSYCFRDCSNLITINIPNVATIKDYSFHNCSKLTTVNAPNATAIGMYAFYNCKKLTEISFPLLAAVDTCSFQNCTALAKAEFAIAKSIGNQVFRGSTAFATLVLRKSDAIVTLSNTNSLESTMIANGTGYIYVPSALIDTYKTAANWSTYANQFRALEDYTVDGTITGALDESKI